MTRKTIKEELKEEVGKVPFEIGEVKILSAFINVMNKRIEALEKEVDELKGEDGCLYCEYYIQTSASCDCTHEKAPELSPDGWCNVDLHRFDKPDWCPLKQEAKE